MARLRHWYLWLPPLVAAAMLVAFLPGRQGPLPMSQVGGHSQEAAVRRAVYRLRQRVFQAELRETRLRDLSRHPSVVRGPVTVSYAAPVTRPEAERWAEALLRSAPAGLDSGSLRGRAVVILLPWDSIQRLSKGPGLYLSQGMLGELAEPCVALIEGSRDRLEYVENGNGLEMLGSCGLVLALGAPGSAVRSWTELRRRSWEPFGAVAAPTQTVKRIVLRRWDASQELTECAAGTPGRCARYVLALPNGEFLEWLLQQYGADALGRFWRYDGSLEGAVHAVYGQPLDVIGSRWVKAHFDLAFGSRPVRWGEASLGGIWMAVFVAVALFAGRTRHGT